MPICSKQATIMATTKSPSCTKAFSPVLESQYEVRARTPYGVSRSTIFVNSMTMARKLSKRFSKGFVASGFLLFTAMAATPRKSEKTTKGIICNSLAALTGLEGMKALNWEKRLVRVFGSRFASSPMVMPLPTEKSDPTSSPMIPARMAVKRKRAMVRLPIFLSSSVELSLSNPVMMLVGTKGMISILNRST
ncbi:hypothetical protein SDC9_142655 [bioreactor metagenome]|uniref:Uncharacterized protein n=1 Tax=bioreactor metagenome TaxID=1076179 RepID=A0A645E1R2_9ZZZZ